MEETISKILKENEEKLEESRNLHRQDIEEVKKEMMLIKSKEIEELEKAHKLEMITLKEKISKLNLKERVEMNVELARKIEQRNQATNTLPRKKTGYSFIDRSNIHLVSHELGGLMQNSDGAWDMTPLFETWIKDVNVQRINTYNIKPNIPQEILFRPHSEPSNLNLKWSHVGEWDQLICFTGDKPVVLAVRIEKFVELDGSIRRAICYGDQAERLNVWFRIEDIMTTHKGWRPTEPNPFYNTKRFNPETRRKEPLTGRLLPAPGDRYRQDLPDPSPVNSRPLYVRPRSSGIGRGRRIEGDQQYEDWKKSQKTRTNTFSSQELVN